MYTSFINKHDYVMKLPLTYEQFMFKEPFIVIFWRKLLLTVRNLGVKGRQNDATENNIALKFHILMTITNFW